MNSTCFQDPIGFTKFSISPEFGPLLVDKDLLHKIFVSLCEIKQELYARSFQLNYIRKKLHLHVENACRKPQSDLKDWSRDLQRIAVNSGIKLSNLILQTTGNRKQIKKTCGQKTYRIHANTVRRTTLHRFCKTSIKLVSISALRLC